METALQINLPTLLLGTALGVAQLLVGIVIGRWLLGGRRQGAANSPNAAAVRDLLGRIQRMARHVATEVHQHRTEIATAESELAGIGEGQDAGLRNSVLTIVGRIVESNERLQGQLTAAEVKLQRQSEQIEIHLASARTDALTGLPNRRAFDEELSRRLAEWRRRKTPVSLLLIDVDFFKKFNDTHGHQAGDAVLRSLGRIMFGCLREMDLLCRYGGEEFAVILPATVADPGSVVAERIRQAVEVSITPFEEKDLKATVSIGVAVAIVGDENETLIKRADAALYAAKAAGRNRVQVCAEGGEMSAPAAETEALRAAHAEAEFDDLCEDLRSQVLRIGDERIR